MLRVLGLLLLFAVPAQAQSTTESSQWLAGVGVQAYPAGVIPQLQLGRVFAEKQVLSLHLGINVTNRRDWGKHDDETGLGVGLGVSWKYYLAPAQSGFFGGIRTDLWFMTIDWEQNQGPGIGIARTGETDITVLQPVAQIGYTYQPSGTWYLEGTLGLGMEINVQTEGEPVGEGAIFLGGLSTGIRF